MKKVSSDSFKKGSLETFSALGWCEALKINGNARKLLYL